MTNLKKKVSVKTGIFFYLGFLPRPFTNHSTAGEGGGHFSNQEHLVSKRKLLTTKLRALRKRIHPNFIKR